MAIQIKIYSQESIENFAEGFASNEKLETGSINAAACALAASLLERASLFAPESEKKDYILRNAGILRNYFVHLIDDDLKARRDYMKLLPEGDDLKIEAAIHPACTINEEIISMCDQMLHLGIELKELIPVDKQHYLKEMAELAYGTVKSCISWLISFTQQSSDETYKFVVKRENELNLEAIKAEYDRY